jgi:hypothetical protein
VRVILLVFMSFLSRACSAHSIALSHNIGRSLAFAPDKKKYVATPIALKHSFCEPMSEDSQEMSNGALAGSYPNFGTPEPTVLLDASRLINTSAAQQIAWVNFPSVEKQVRPRRIVYCFLYITIFFA